LTEQENPHVHDHQSLQKALDLLASGGSLTEAALLLEATITSGTADEQASRIASFGGGGEAGVWVLLGQTQAMDEKEVAAVRALEEGRRRFEARSRELTAEAKRTMGEGLIVSVVAGLQRMVLVRS
jgi:peroxin-5